MIIEQLVRKRGVEGLVVGLPLNAEGKRGPQAQRTEAFIDILIKRVELPVHWVDERFTTAQSERVLLEGDVSRKRRKQVIDQLAAQLILQDYLEKKRESDER